MNETVYKIRTQDQEEIALWKIDAGGYAVKRHVFLTHGTFSNRKVCMGIASYLVEQGYCCWILEWRNHGASSRTTQPFNFESIALYDFLAVFDFLFEEQEVDSLSCITHSGGGLCLSMFLVQNQEYITKINRIVFFGCQSFGAATDWLAYTKILLGKYATLLIGKIPAKQKQLGEHDESYFTMKQWFDWNLTKKFDGANNVNYLAKMPCVTIPVLSICGKGDTFIAPIKGCQQFLDAFQNTKNSLLFCSKENGYLEDYSHSRILHSSNAKKEIWPLVLNWIKAG